MTEREAAIHMPSGARLRWVDIEEARARVRQLWPRFDGWDASRPWLGRARRAGVAMRRALGARVKSWLMSLRPALDAYAQRFGRELPSLRLAIALVLAVSAIVAAMILLLKQVMPPWRAALWTSAIMTGVGLCLLQMTITVADARARLRFTWVRAARVLRDARGPRKLGSAVSRSS